MNDLEATRLCAEAMGLGPSSDCVVSGVILKNAPSPNSSHHYDPLNNDAQAMALVKRFRLFVEHSKTRVTVAPSNWNVDDAHTDTDLNRAIVYCVAKMQAAKTQ